MSLSRTFSAAFLVVALLLASSLHAQRIAPPIPGTNIVDTGSNRAILAVCEKYREATLRQDPSTILRVVSPRYHDDNGTPNPSDDIDLSELERLLQRTLTGTLLKRYEVRYLRIVRADDLIHVDLEFSAAYEIDGRVHERRGSNRITLEDTGGQYLILRGL